MELFSPAGGRKGSPPTQDAVVQLRDIGARLRHLVARYDHLVTRVTDGGIPTADLGGRIDWLELQLVAAAEQLQEVILLEHRSARTVPFRRRPARPALVSRPLILETAIEGSA